MKPLHAITHPSRIQDVRFYMDDDGVEYLLVAAEDKKVTFYELGSRFDPESRASLPIVIEAVGHENRWKFCLSSFHT